MRFILFFCLLAVFCFTSCCRSSIDFKKEGESWTYHFIKELREIKSAKELNDKAPYFKSLMDRLVDLMIAAKKYMLTHPSETDDLFFKDFSEALATEMERIYSLEGGRETMEKIQKSALLRLHTFDITLRRRTR